MNSGEDSQNMANMASLRGKHFFREVKQIALQHVTFIYKKLDNITEEKRAPA